MGTCHAECALEGAPIVATNDGICWACRSHYSAGDQVVVPEKQEDAE